MQVIEALPKALATNGGNPSRGGHKLALCTAEAVYSARANVADFFGTVPENVAFTLNCTYALNMAIKGVMGKSGHIIISSLEHNSVSRPVYALSRESKVSFSIANVHDDDKATLQEVEKLIKPTTKALVFTLASNVTGQITPYRQIGEICKRKGICFIADASQLCGARQIRIGENGDGMDIICTSGHKGLYGPPGTGILVSNGKYPIKPIIEGGTGTDSKSLVQAIRLPEALEAGTVNTSGIIALSKGIDFVKDYTCERIFDEETKLCELFIAGLEKIDGFKIYRTKGASYAPIVSFNFKDISPDKIASYLDSNGICTRAGLHCAALAHNQLKTAQGTVRFAPSVFNKKEEVLKTLRILENTDKILLEK